MGYEHIEIEVEDGVGTLWLNRPDKLNAVDAQMWADIPQAVSELDRDSSVRVIVAAGRGKAFTVGIDLGFLSSILQLEGSPSIRSKRVYEEVRKLQATNNAFANSPKPSIAAIHGYCLGEGLSLATACDIRLATSDAVLSVRETKLGVVADVGVLQRLPDIVGAGHAAELAMTGEDISGSRAEEIGLVNKTFADHASMMAGARDLAFRIASNSPLAVGGVKQVLAANSGRTVDEALDFVAHWNAAYLISDDLMESIAAFVEGRDPEFKGT